MFFIVSNYTKDAPFKVSKANNLSVIETQSDNVKFSSIEDNSPVQFFCINHIVDGSFHREALQMAKHFTVEAIFEKEMPVVIDDANQYSNLISDFGDKKSRDRISKRGLVNYTPVQSVMFNIENQLLPEFNRDAETPHDLYSIDLMFGRDILTEFNQIEVNVDGLSDFVKGIYKSTLKTQMLLLDCLYKMLSERIITERLFGQCEFFFTTVKDSLVKGKLPSLVRDKYVMKFYIILLIVCGFEFNLDHIPKFSLTHEKVVLLLKTLGCTVSKNGQVKLENHPKETFTTKRLRK